MPAEMTIVKGSDSTKASLVAEEKSDTNTASITNKIVKSDPNKKENKKDNNKENNNGAKTGDDTSIMLYVILGIISLGGISTVAVIKRKMQ